MKIHWWEFPRRRTCHVNVPGMSYDESYLGEVFDTDAGWTYKVKGDTEEREVYSSPEKASRALLTAVGGEPVTTWD